MAQPIPNQTRERVFEGLVDVSLLIPGTLVSFRDHAKREGWAIYEGVSDERGSKRAIFFARPARDIAVYGARVIKDETGKEKVDFRLYFFIDWCRPEDEKFADRDASLRRYER